MLFLAGRVTYLLCDTMKYVRDLTTNFLTEMCHQVWVEPELQVVSDPAAFSQATSNIIIGGC